MFGGTFSMQFFPQLYYLKQNEHDGMYFTATVGLSRKNLPLSIASTINQELSGDIPGSKNFVWNLSLVYGFNTGLTARRAG
jgi:hypothetical protein